jgi:hypothetical protein
MCTSALPLSPVMAMSAVGYLLGTPSISRYRCCHYRALKCVVTSGNNPSSADNQQERPEVEQWIVGFVDGEGCFSAPIQRNAKMRLGWQLQPVFTVVQGESSVVVLELIRDYFGCGRIYRNRRHDNHREDLMNYQVFRMGDLPNEDHSILRSESTENREG